MSDNKRLREDSENLFRTQARNAVPVGETDSMGWHYAVEGAVGAALAIEDSFVASGYPRKAAQDRASAVLGGHRLRQITQEIHRIVVQPIEAVQNPILNLREKPTAIESSFMGDDC